jgi:MFS transporter, DHA1 family, multidrug resistance protein
MQKNAMSGFHLLILALMTSFAAVLAVLFTPALPELARYFAVSEGASQTTMTLYLLGYACGMLIYGPLANRFGRKFALFIGLGIALVSSLLAILTGEARLFWLFCILRFVQALGASCGLKIAMTMIADTFLIGEKASRAISIVVLSFVLAPAIGVAIGGGLVTYFGWQGCFVFMALYSAALLFLGILLPETASHRDHQALQISKIFIAYKRQFQSSFIIFHGVLMGLSIASFYLFAALGPYIGIDKMGLSAATYGLLAIIPPFGFGVGAIVNTRYATKFSPHQLMLWGILCSLVGAIAMLICFVLQFLNIVTLFFLMGVIEIGSALIYPNASAVALMETSDKSSASATLQFLSIGMAFVATLITSIIPIYQPVLLPILVCLCIVAMLIIWLKIKMNTAYSYKQLSP